MQFFSPSLLNIHIFIHTSTCAQTHPHVNKHTHMCTNTPTCAQTHPHVHKQNHMCTNTTNMCTNKPPCAQTHPHVHKHTYMCKNTYKRDHKSTHLYISSRNAIKNQNKKSIFSLNCASSTLSTFRLFLGPMSFISWYWNFL